VRLLTIASSQLLDRIIRGTLTNHTPDTVLAIGDPGDDTARHYRYQWTYAAIICCMLLDETEKVAEVFCEHHEDVLLKHVDGTFSGLQVKTRASDQEVCKTNDAVVKGSCARFAKLEAKFPGQFRAFRFLTNHPLHAAGNGQDLHQTLRAIMEARSVSSLSGPVAKFLTSVSRGADCAAEVAFTALSKTNADDGLPKLSDIEVRVVGTLTGIWECAADCSYAAVQRAARHRTSKCERASSLAHQDVLPAYLPARVDPVGTELAARIAGKRINRLRVLDIYDQGLNETALLNGEPETIMGPGAGSKDILLKKLDTRGFSAVSLNSAMDLMDKADYLGTRWTKKYGRESGLQRCDHAKSLVLSDAARAFESTKNERHPFGLQRMVEWPQDVSDARDSLDSFKLDLFQMDVLAFTPKGKLIQLTRNATPIDFAYAIHTQIGDQCVGAKVNGKIVPLKYKIQNGDVVKVMTTPGHKPSLDWLNFVITSKARNKIKHRIAEFQRVESIKVRRKIFEKEAAKLRLKTKQVLLDPQLAKFLNDNSYAKIDDTFAAIGYDKLIARTILAPFVKTEDMTEFEQSETTTKLRKVPDAVKRVRRDGDRILIKGIDDKLVYRAPYGGPIRGEEIIGYIMRGKGVQVHTTRCKNAANLMVNRERIVEVAWMTDHVTNLYAVRVTEDRAWQLAALTSAIANIKPNIRNASTDDEVLNDGTRRFDLIVDVISLQHLECVVSALKCVGGVIRIEHYGVVGSE
jgi:molybdopterin converting factor small subunit